MPCVRMCLRVLARARTGTHVWAGAFAKRAMGAQLFGLSRRAALDGAGLRPPGAQLWARAACRAASFKEACRGGELSRGEERRKGAFVLHPRLFRRHPLGPFPFPLHQVWPSLRPGWKRRHGPPCSLTAGRRVALESRFPAHPPASPWPPGGGGGTRPRCSAAPGPGRLGRRRQASVWPQ